MKKLNIAWRQSIKQLYLASAIGAFSLGGLVAYMGNTSANPLLIALGFGGLAGGSMLFLAWRRKGDVRYIGKGKKERGEEYKPPNSLDIYPDRIEFAFSENPLGQSQKCLNDGNYYHVHKVVLGELEEFRLPDDDESQRYYDPTEFANPVTMPSNKKYFTWAASTMQKISVGVMALIIGGLVIGMIVMGG